MAYVETIWTNGGGEPINSTNLNNMEEGIATGVAHSEAPHAPFDAEKNVLHTVVDADYVHTDLNFTSILKTNYDIAYVHSQQTHAPSDAEKNHVDTVVDANYVQTEVSYTNDEKTKLSNIESEAQKNHIDTALKSVANTFTKPQRTSITVEDNTIDFRLNNNFTLGATVANMSYLGVDECIGQSGVVVIDTAENVTGWDSSYTFKNVPIDLIDTEVFAYFIKDATTIIIGRVV